jgi:hypothetical protein
VSQAIYEELSAKTGLLWGPCRPPRNDSLLRAKQGKKGPPDAFEADRLEAVVAVFYDINFGILFKYMGHFTPLLLSAGIYHTNRDFAKNMPNRAHSIAFLICAAQVKNQVFHRPPLMAF